jgi:hypothetical protein
VKRKCRKGKFRKTERVSKVLSENVELTEERRGNPCGGAIHSAEGVNLLTEIFHIFAAKFSKASVIKVILV